MAISEELGIPSAVSVCWAVALLVVLLVLLGSGFSLAYSLSAISWLISSSSSTEIRRMMKIPSWVTGKAGVTMKPDESSSSSLGLSHRSSTSASESCLALGSFVSIFFLRGPASGNRSCLTGFRRRAFFQVGVSKSLWVWV